MRRPRRQSLAISTGSSIHHCDDANRTCLIVLWPHAVQSVAQGRVFRLTWPGNLRPAVEQVTRRTHAQRTPTNPKRNVALPPRFVRGNIRAHSNSSGIRAARKVVLRKMANRECIVCDVGFRPQTATLCARSESRIGNSRDISEGCSERWIPAKHLIYNGNFVAEPEGFEPSIRLYIV